MNYCSKCLNPLKAVNLIIDNKVCSACKAYEKYEDGDRKHSEANGEKR